MAGKNYLYRQQALYQGFFDAGEEIGMQKMWDYLQIALRDQDTMGKDTIGRKRMEKIFYKAKELADYFCLAFSDDVEADHRQEELDRCLREIWGDDLTTFYDRYPQLKKQRYDRAKEVWR